MAARFWTLSSIRWLIRFVLSANSSSWTAAATPRGIASTAVVPITQMEPRIAGRAPARAGDEDGYSVNSRRSSRGAPSIKVVTIRTSSTVIAMNMASHSNIKKTMDFGLRSPLLAVACRDRARAQVSGDAHQ